MHPTPAVCGRPRSEAKAVLAENEPFDRGYYAGPFGWISGSAAEFVVAIRSALMQAPPEHQSTTPLSQSDSLPSVDKLAAATDSSEADIQQYEISGLDGANTSDSSREVPPATNGNASSHLRASSETFGVRQQQSSRKPSTAQPAAEAHIISL